MKLSEEEVEQIIAKNPLQMFDICIKCSGTQLYQTMQAINEEDFDLICDECSYEELCELIRGDSPDWTHEEVVEKLELAMDCLKFVEEEVDYKEYGAWLIKQREDFEKFEESEDE